MVTENRIVCPIPEQPNLYGAFTPCPESELEPLLAHLRANHSVAGTTAFVRGTVTASGTLDLCKQSVGVDGCRAVLSALDANTQIKSLLLGTDGIGDAGAQAVADCIARSEALSTIYLGCNRIGADGAAHLASALSENETVVGLWLKRNPIGDAGAFAIAEMLRRNRTLRVLDMVNTGFGAAGFVAVIEALLEGNNTVERLYLSGNGLTEESAPYFAQLLRKNGSLRGLYLSVNHLGDAGTVVLAQALAENNALEELALASNDIGDTGLAALLAAARHHPALRMLDLSYSPSTRVLGATANQFTKEQSTAPLADFLRANTPLISLDLRSTGLKLDDSVYEAIAMNTNIVTFLHDGKQDKRIRDILQSNQEQSGNAFPLSQDVAPIRSVYR